VRHQLQLATQRALVEAHRVGAIAVEEEVGIELQHGNPFDMLLEVAVSSWVWLATKTRDGSPKPSASRRRAD
jgi:hypothetical protein